MPTIDIDVAANTDDGYIEGSSIETGPMYCGYYYGSRSGWLRFPGVSGLSGATITAAYFNNNGEGQKTGTPNVRIYGNKVAAPVAPTSASDYNAKAVTSAYASWTGDAEDSPSLVGVIQEIVDSYDPTAIMLLLKDNGSPTNEHFYYYNPYDWGGLSTLHIEYTEGGTQQAVSGAITPAGALVIQTRKPLAGAITPSGVVSTPLPVVESTNNSGGTSLAGGVSLAMPSGIATGDLILHFCVNDAPSTTQMTMANYTRIYEGAYTSNTIRCAVFARIATGSDTATLAGASQDYAAVSVRISNHGVEDVSTDIKVGTQAIGSTWQPDPPSLDAGLSDWWLWIAFAGSDDDDDNAGTYYPTSYAGLGQRQSASSTSSCLMQAAYRLRRAQTEDPGVFSLTSSSTPEEWITNTIAVPGYYAPTGEYTQTVSGAISPSGTVVKLAGKGVTGALTPAGTLINLTQKLLAGELTPAGVVAAVKMALVSLTGSITPDGSLVKQTSKSLAGVLTPDGTLVRQVRKILDGVLTPAGELMKRAGKGVAGSLTPDGTLSRATRKMVSGALTSAGELATELSHGLKEAILGGVLAPAGELTKRAGKILAGEITPSGTVINQARKILAGAVQPAGALINQARKVLAGEITPSGIVAASKAALMSLAGGITPAGELIRKTSKSLAGSLSPDGALTRATSKILSGFITPTGEIVRRTLKSLAGSLTSAGDLLASLVLPGVYYQAISGAIAPAGDLVKRTYTNLAGAIAPAGTVVRRISKQLTGKIKPIGDLYRFLTRLMIPRGHTYLVPFDNRTVLVGAELRLYQVDQDNRIIIPKESRVIRVANEDRVVIR